MRLYSLCISGEYHLPTRHRELKTKIEAWPPALRDYCVARADYGRAAAWTRGSLPLGIMLFSSWIEQTMLNPVPMLRGRIKGFRSQTVSQNLLPSLAAIELGIEEPLTYNQRHLHYFLPCLQTLRPLRTWRSSAEDFGRLNSTLVTQQHTKAAKTSRGNTSMSWKWDNVIGFRNEAEGAWWMEPEMTVRCKTFIQKTDHKLMLGTDKHSIWRQVRDKLVWTKGLC